MDLVNFKVDYVIRADCGNGKYLYYDLSRGAWFDDFYFYGSEEHANHCIETCFPGEISIKVVRVFFREEEL